MAFIQQNQQQQRPFFVYLPDNCPHGPFDDVPPAEYELYKNLNLENDQFPQESGHPLPPQADTDKRARIFAMVTNVDNNLGRLRKKLDELGIAEHTIVIFLCDNGPNGRRYVMGMQGMKSQVFEGGIRCPFIIHWPAKIQAGHCVTAPSAHIDVLPTLLDACGVRPPADLKLDGRSFLPDLLGAKVKRSPRTIFIQSHRGNVPVRYHNFAARGPVWKLVHPSGFGREDFNGEPNFQLFNLQTDPLEMNNVATAHPDVVASMKAEYDAWFDDVSSTRPDNYAPPRIYVGTPHENPVVLTRQDWRHTQGAPWSRNSAGHWLLYVASDATYDVNCRFEPDEAAGEAVLAIDGRETTLSLPAGAQSCRFESVSLKRGNIRLEVVLKHNGQSRGIHQAEVVKQ
jgi:arylsulfatase/arylsulfatase A